MSKNTKFKQYSVVAVLFVIALVLVGFIYTSTQSKDGNGVMAEVNDQSESPNVEEINTNQSNQVIDEVEDDKIVVEAIDTDQDEVVDVVIDEDQVVDVSTDESNSDDSVGDRGGTEAEMIVIETIEEPVAEEPEKPEETPPEELPKTDDDLTNPDVVPEYDETEVTYTPEVEEEEPVEEVRGTNQVPDSENPFLQDDIPSNGDGGEEQGSDYYQDGNQAGEGDKF
jgi:hypothetical protein